MYSYTFELMETQDIRRFFIIGIILFSYLIINSANSYHIKDSEPLKKRSPVIFRFTCEVPSFGESQLNAKLNKTNMPDDSCKCISESIYVWLNILLLFAFEDCFVSTMKLNYHNDTRTTTNTEGVEITVPGWGDPLSVEYLEPNRACLGYYFKHIGDMLMDDMGYVRNLSLRGAPYDYRKGPNEHKEFFIKLKLLVEETYKINNNQPMTLIAHSRGGLMSLIFLQRQSQEWKDKYINSLITLATPRGGTVKALKVFAIGDDLGSEILGKSVMRQQQITVPGLGFLLPSRLFWGENEILVQTPEKNYTLLDLQEFFNDINVPNAWELGSCSDVDNVNDMTHVLQLTMIIICKHKKTPRKYEAI